MGAIEAMESKQGAGSRQRYFQGESDKGKCTLRI